MGFPVWKTECCTHEAVMGRKRPKVCEHGRVFERVREEGEQPRSRSRRSTQPDRDWSLARAKIEEEGGICRVCAAFSAEAAHIMGRKFDQPITPGSRTLLVLPDRIVPLCSERFGHGCHARYDAHALDLLPHLTTAEQAQAVLDAGSIVGALKRISPEPAL